MRRLYERFLTTASGGNVSLRISNQNVLITPSGLDKGNITENQIAEVSLEGVNQTKNLKPSIETRMHFEIYKRHTDASAVVLHT